MVGKKESDILISFCPAMVCSNIMCDLWSINDDHQKMKLIYLLFNLHDFTHSIFHFIIFEFTLNPTINFTFYFVFLHHTALFTFKFGFTHLHIF